MIDIELLRQNPGKFKGAVKAKQLDPKLVDRALKLDKKWREALQAAEELRRERNILSKKRTKQAITKAKKVKQDLKKLDKDLREITEKYEAAVKKIPNLIADDVHVGKDESDNKVIRTVGKVGKFDFKPRDHVELGEMHNIINVKKASQVSGARYNYLLNEAALLEFALVQYTFEVLTDREVLKSIAEKVGKKYSSKAFVPVVPPVMIRPEVFDKMARLHPKDERFYIESDDLFLIGSAEHTLGALHMDEVLDEESLPIRYIGFSSAFRREAGSYGKDTRGILRVHQFDKLEMESFTTPENGLSEQEFIIGIQEYLMKSLEIPYQVVMICTGDMGAPDYRQVDIESWIPSQGKYRETHTSDYMTDYQARRLNTKFRRKGKTEFVHMNDATAFAVGRTIIAILENYQQKDGSIVIPEVLRKWVGKDKLSKGSD
jgi:seryl-tRNA synthetase